MLIFLLAYWLGALTDRLSSHFPRLESETMNRSRRLSPWAVLYPLFCLVCLAGCGAAGGRAESPASSALPARISPVAGLKAAIDDMVAKELLPYTLASIKIVSLANGATLYETNATLLLPAASVQKLFTAAAALDLLGPGHLLETSLALSSDRATIYLKGCGDPLLETADLHRLALDLAGKLPLDREYALAGDTSCLDDAYWGHGWMWDDEPGPDAMYLSALSVNRNVVALSITPGPSPATALTVTIDPPTGYVTIENKGTTGPRGGPCAVEVARRAGDRENLIRIGGSLAPGCPAAFERISVWRPELYTLALVREQLQRSGYRIASPAIRPMPDGTTRLGAVQHSVGEIVTFMLKHSDNLCAENLLKYMAHVKSGQPGSAAGGIALVSDYLAKKGIPTEHLVIADGSGVSRYNLTNVDTITRLLTALYHDETIFPVVAGALPHAGQDGALAGRMRETPAVGRVKAKTGSVQGVSALAGYTVTAAGEPLAFAINLQNFDGPSRRVREIQDRIAVLLSTLGEMPGERR